MEMANRDTLEALWWAEPTPWAMCRKSVRPTRGVGSSSGLARGLAGLCRHDDVGLSLVRRPVDCRRQRHAGPGRVGLSADTGVGRGGDRGRHSTAPQLMAKLRYNYPVGDALLGGCLEGCSNALERPAGCGAVGGDCLHRRGQPAIWLSMAGMRIINVLDFRLFDAFWRKSIILIGEIIQRYLRGR